MSTIILKRMGMNFLPGDRMNRISDVGNHRVRAEFIDYAGRNTIIDFSHVSGKKTLLVDAQYSQRESNCKFEHFYAHPNYRYGVNLGLTFNWADILKTINVASAEQYDEIRLENMEG